MPCGLKGCPLLFQDNSERPCQPQNSLEDWPRPQQLPESASPSMHQLLLLYASFSHSVRFSPHVTSFPMHLVFSVRVSFSLCSQLLPLCQPFLTPPQPRGNFFFCPVFPGSVPKSCTSWEAPNNALLCVRVCLHRAQWKPSGAVSIVQRNVFVLRGGAVTSLQGSGRASLRRGHSRRP